MPSSARATMVFAAKPRTRMFICGAALPSRPSVTSVQNSAARTGSPIFAEDALIEEAGIEEEEGEESAGDEEEMVEELRKFLDEVNPEDFLPE